ncbi:MAG: amidophosphoribosyltransferase [Eubacterium sp.]|nr:amidophosphoribosyltransferase [Eubacterium sp.]
MGEEKFHDECGVMGVYAEDKSADVAAEVYYGLYALQHRGQESAGISINQEGRITTHKDVGLVADVFKGGALDKLKGSIGIGHVRYATSGEGGVTNAQPLTVNLKAGQIALAHNGNLVNDKALREMLEDSGVVFQTTIDTEVMVDILARGLKHGVVEAIRRMVEIIKGAYALVITLEDKLIGVRDPYGLRPICLGKKDGMYILASESCAIDTVGGELIRDLEPGEIVIIDKDGLKSYGQKNWVGKRACIFEQIYFARPDSIMEGRSVYQARHTAGRILAKESPVEADVVIGVPDSGIPAAIGYAKESGIPYGIGLIKNKYSGRTFIQPNQKLREVGVRLKLNPLRDTIAGKRVIIIDDSIVRGTTSKRLVEILREGGAAEVHFRVTSPPVTHTCHFGIDTPEKKHLIGARNTVEEIREILGADSLAYISLEGLNASVGGGTEYCRACFDGDYPMEVPVLAEDEE